MLDAALYAGKPWLALYTPGLPATISAESEDLLTLFASAIQRADGGAENGIDPYRDDERPPVESFL